MSHKKSAPDITPLTREQKASTTKQKIQKPRHIEGINTTFHIVWGTPRSCTPAMLEKALLPLLQAEDSGQVTIKRSFKTRNNKRKWWFTIIAPQATMALIEGSWPSLEKKTSWRLQSSLKPPACRGSPSEGCEHNQQLVNSAQVQLLANTRATSSPPSSHAPPTNETPPDVAMPATANSTATASQENSDPSLTPDIPSSSLLDSFLLPNTPLPTANSFLEGPPPPEASRTGGPGGTPLANPPSLHASVATNNLQHPSAPSTGMDGRKSLIRVGCHNVRGLKTNTAYTHACISNIDIFVISEHWLHSFELNQLAVFHPEFNFYAASHPTDEDTTYCIPHTIRGQGGVAIAWRKSLNHLICKLPHISHRIVGIQLLTASRPTCLLSVYLPTRSGATDEFKEALDLLDATLGLYGLDNEVYILGDLNADLGTEGGPQAYTPANEHSPILLRYLRRWKYLSYYLHLSPSQPTHTYESEAHGTLSTIDHFLGLLHMLSSISKCAVGEEDPINTSDHLPILAQMELCFCPHSASSPLEPQNQTHSKPNWNKPMEIEALYAVPIEEQLSQIKCPTMEECLENPTLIDQHLTTLTTLMPHTAHNSIPPKKFSPHKKQGWNDKLRQAQRTAQQAYKAWKAAGKPRSSDHPVATIINHLRENSALF